jgi:ABC-type sugar transport system ATPase subunit
MSLIEAKSVSGIYKTGDVQDAALRDVTLSIAAREFVAFVGPSGSGKSTLLNLVDRLDHPTNGSLTVMGADMARLGRSAAAAFRGEHLGFVFQEFNLMPVLSAYENAEYPLLMDQAFAAGAGRALQALAHSLVQSGYGRFNPGRNYAYLRVSAKAPFDWLYVSPSVTSIVNLDDQSYQLTFELPYTGWENVELRLRGILTHGDQATEFGEKPSAQRVELRLRLYF